MAQTLKTYQLNLSENRIKLREIGQRVKPYLTSFNFEKNGKQISVSFNDDLNNEIDVFFHPTDSVSNSYEIEFNINKYSQKAFTTSTSHFFKIISTVLEVIEQFIIKFKPFKLYIEPDDLPNKIGQKYKIWMEYIKVNLKDKNYILGKFPNGFSIQLNQNIKTN